MIARYVRFRNHLFLCINFVPFKSAWYDNVYATTRGKSQQKAEPMHAYSKETVGLVPCMKWKLEKFRDYLVLQISSPHMNHDRMSEYIGLRPPRILFCVFNVRNFNVLYV